MHAKAKEEFAVLTNYLVGETATLEMCALYTHAIATLGITVDGHDARVWQWALRHAWCLPLIDAGLRMTQPQHPICKKITTAFAIVETQPAFAQHFLFAPQRFVLAQSTFIGLRAVTRALIGMLVVTAVFTKRNTL
jgi:hypothetical protein